MAGISDQSVLSNAMTEESLEYIFSKKDYEYLEDSNTASSYTQGRIPFRGATLANSNDILNWRDAISITPTVRVLSFPTPIVIANLNRELAFGCSYKNSSTTLIHSLTTSVGGYQVIDPQENQELDNHFKLMSTMSQDDVVQWGDLMGFSKDTFQAVNYGAVGGTLGIGECNNNIANLYTVATTPAVSVSPGFTTVGGFGNSSMNINLGRRNRMVNGHQCFDIGNTVNTSLQNINATNCGSFLKSYCEPILNTAGDWIGYKYYDLIAIPLRFLHPFFNAMPLSKNANINIDLVTNMNAKCDIVTGANGATYTSYTTTTSTGVFPLQLTPLGVGKGIPALTGNTSITLSLGIAKSYDGTISHPFLTKCRIYVPKYKFTPTFDENYFSSNKIMRYEDRLTSPVVTVVVGASVNNLQMTQSVQRPRYLAVYPFQSATSHLSSAAAGSGVSPLNSPFSCAPCQTCPYAFLTNINVKCGSALFEVNLDYSYLHYVENMRTINSTNGGQILGVSSGLLSFNEWCCSPVYIFDLTHFNNEADDMNAKTILFSCKNNCQKDLDLYFCINYLRIETFSPANGLFVND